MAIFDDEDLKKAENSLNKAQQFLNQNNPLNQKTNFGADGFSVPETPTADGVGLPFSKVRSNLEGTLRRNIITWFVPEFGAVKMYINPSQISYQFKKIIGRDRTKGGYALQYWGEDLITLNINGTTGSAGIEGINMLYEIYRAEQLAFDTTGLVVAANNSAAQDILSLGLNEIGGAIGGATGSTLFGGVGQGTGVVGGILGLNSPAAALGSNEFTSLARLAFTVEMYYNGWVYRGFFESMTITEDANDFLLKYNIVFTATQKRGYRTNYFPWARSPQHGPSRVDTPYSFSSMANGPKTSQI